MGCYIAKSEHTIFQCPKFDRKKIELVTELGTEITDNILENMPMSKADWTKVTSDMHYIMKMK